MVLRVIMTKTARYTLCITRLTELDPTLLSIEQRNGIEASLHGERERAEAHATYQVHIAHDLPRLQQHKK